MTRAHTMPLGNGIITPTEDICQATLKKYLEEIILEAMDTERGSDGKCPINIDPSLRLPTHKRKKEESIQAKFDRINPGLTEAIEAEKVSNYDLKQYSDRLEAMAPYIMVDIGDSKYISRRVKVKGTAAYALDRYNALRGIETAIDAMGQDTIFATLTFARDITSLDEYGEVQHRHLTPLESWRLGRERIAKFCRRLVEVWGATYLWVAEAQTSGHVHYHMVIILPHTDLCKGGAKKGGGYYCNNDNLRYWIKQQWGLENHLDITIADAGRATGYVTKYLSKTWTDEEEACADRETLDAIRKSRLAIALSTYSKCRMYSYSKVLSPSRPELKKIAERKALDEARAEIEDIGQKSGYEVDLISSCITSACPKFNKTILMAGIDKMRVFRDTIGGTLDADSNAVVLAKDLGLSLGCRGCILTEYARILDAPEAHDKLIDAYNRAVIVADCQAHGEKIPKIVIEPSNIAAAAAQSVIALYKQWLLDTDMAVWRTEIAHKRYAKQEDHKAEEEEGEEASAS
jgi:hypothetical protein